MRGGAIPMLAWATLLLVLYATNWIWERGQPVQIYTTVFAILVIAGSALWLWLRRREAVRKGAPHAERVPEALPEMSVGAVGAGLAIATILYGFVWAHFLVYFGAGLLIACLGRLGFELHSQRRSVRDVPRRLDAAQATTPTPAAGVGPVTEETRAAGSDGGEGD